MKLLFLTLPFLNGYDLDLFPKRLLYSTSSSANDCDRCLSQGKNHCWERKSSGIGSWYKSYCCGPSDIKCNNLDYCSEDVSGDKQLMSCPTADDSDVCPKGSEVLISLNRAGTSVSRQESWSSLEIKEKVYCKYKISFSGTLPEFTTSSKILIDIKISNVPTWILEIDNKFSDSSIQ